MRHRWGKLRWLGATWVLAAGCWHTQSSVPTGSVPTESAPVSWWQSVSAKLWKKEPELKPPEHPEELTTPPADDARYSKTVAYPPETLNQTGKKAGKTPGFPDGPPGVGGMGGGMGGGMRQ